FHIELSEAGAAAAEVGSRAAAERGKQRRGAGERTSVTQAGGNWEQAIDLFKRLNSAATANAVPEAQLAELRRIREATERSAAKAGSSGHSPTLVGLPGWAAAGEDFD